MLATWLGILRWETVHLCTPKPAWAPQQGAERLKHCLDVSHLVSEQEPGCLWLCLAHHALCPLTAR